MRSSARLMGILILVAFVVVSLPVTVSAASKKYALPTSAKIYEDYDHTGSWTYANTMKIKYNKKGDPVRYGSNTISYKYKGKKRKKMVVNTPDDEDYGGKIVIYYNKNGHVYKTSQDGKVSVNKKGWINRERYGAKHKMSFKYYKNGSPKLIKVSGEYTKFNKKGLPTLTKLPYSGEVIYSKFLYSYDKKGRVKTLILKKKYEGESWKKELKVVFSYSKKRNTSHQRKWAVIISNTAGGAFSLGPYYFASLPYAVQNDLW